MRYSLDSNRKSSNGGFSLISLMVGLAISALTILAGLFLHTNNQVAVAQLHRSILHDQRISKSMNIITKQIQSAGYNIPNASIQDVHTTLELSTAISPTTRTLMWRYIADDASIACRGIEETGGTLDGNDYRILNLISSDADCTLGTPLQSMAWDLSLIHI